MNIATNYRRIISTLQIIQPDFFVEIVRTVAEGVDFCDTNKILRNGTYAPSVVGVACDHLALVVGNGNDVALKILDEVIGNSVVENTANAVLVVVKGNEGVVAPGLLEDLGSVKRVIVLDAVNGLACSKLVHTRNSVNF